MDRNQQSWHHGYPTAAPMHQPRRRSRGGRVVAGLAGGVGFALVVAAGVTGWSLGSHGAGAGDLFSASNGQSRFASDTNGDISTAANKVAPGLVNINTVLGAQNGQGAGTGIVLTANGEVLTNNHVVEGATQISVTDVGNGQTYSASVAGYDRTKDVAVLRLANASGLATASIGDSNNVKVGDQVAGVGNAGGSGGAPSVATGKVTALNQDITASDESTGSAEKLSGLIQVSANIQPGDSGGSLVNSSGQVIGVDTAASQNYRMGQGGGQPSGGPSRGGQSNGGQSNGGQSNDGQSGGGQSAAKGFAIPIDQAMAIAHQIEAGASSATTHIGSTAMLGVAVSEQASGAGAESGAVVQQVVSDGPAAQSGLARGDVITKVDGQPVASPTALTGYLDQHHPGDQVSVTWTDQSGQSHTATAALAEGPVG